MKKLKIFLVAALLCVFVAAVSFVACTDNSSNNQSGTSSDVGGSSNNNSDENSKHTDHSPSSEWGQSATEHWQVCGVGGEVLTGTRAAHKDDIDDGLCDTCKYVVDEVKGKLIRFTLKVDGTYEIVGADKSITGKLTIPSTYKKVAVTSIETGIPGSGAFKDCNKITELVIPNSITYIEDAQFFGCSGLTSITIPFVGEYSNGSGQTNFGHLFVRYSYNYYNDYVPNSLKNVKITGGAKIDSEAFRYCSSIEKIELPETVTEIGASAFRDCTNLASINLPNAISEVKPFMFSGCSNLTSLTIPNNVVSIGKGAFKECVKLTALNIPDNVTSVSGAFYGCSAEIKWGANAVITTIGDEAFSEYTGANITLPDSITSIGEEAFKGCTAQIKWGDNPTITEIGTKAFYGYAGTNLYIPLSVVSIGRSALGACKNLTSITYPGDRSQWAAIQKSYSGLRDSVIINCIDGVVGQD